MNKINSLNSKIFLSFFLLGIFLLTILFLLVIPQMYEKEKNHTINQIESMIYLTNQQINLVMQSKKNNGEIRREELKSIMESESNRITKYLNQSSSTKIIEDSIFQFNSKKISCNTTLLDKNKDVLYQKKEEDFNQIKNELKNNSFTRFDKTDKYICSTGTRKLLYTKKIQNHNNYLLISCNIDDFNTKGENFELNLKKEIQKSFTLMENFHKGKTYLMWLNPNIKDINKPLLSKDDTYFNEKYCLSKISKFDSPKTGLLSTQEIINAIDKEPIRHYLSSKENPNKHDKATLTWIKSISLDENEYFLYITSIYEEDFLQHIDSTYLKIVPAAIISFLVAIIVVSLLFKRLFKSINILKEVAFKINKGEKNIRSNIKGNDDIAILANAFDNMLDSLEDNIKTLDDKVELKTKQLSHSLNEKETLLKEIHHRVKNNLAITIDLIKLEKAKIKNQDTKNTLTNIQDKIFVMELLHRKLYESKDLNLIPLKNYLEELCFDLQMSYSNEDKVQINTNIDELQINIDYALPLGLVITELITNSFKYAFKDKGEINLNLKKENDYFKLILKDNGKGLDKNIDIYNTQTLGFQIITNIVKGQLSSKLEYSYQNGAKFQVDFKIPI